MTAVRVTWKFNQTSESELVVCDRISSSQKEEKNRFAVVKTHKEYGGPISTLHSESAKCIVIEKSF